MFQKSADLSVKIFKKQRGSTNKAVSETLVEAWTWFWRELKNVETAGVNLTWIANDECVWLQNLLGQLKEVAELVQNGKMKIREAASQQSSGQSYYIKKLSFFCSKGSRYFFTVNLIIGKWMVFN